MMCETCEGWELLWQAAERRMAEWFARQPSGDPTPFVKGPVIIGDFTKIDWTAEKQDDTPPSTDLPT